MSEREMPFDLTATLERLRRARGNRGRIELSPQESRAIHAAAERTCDAERETAHLREVNAALVEALEKIAAATSLTHPQMPRDAYAHAEWRQFWHQRMQERQNIARAALAAAEPRGEGGRG